MLQIDVSKQLEVQKKEISALLISSTNPVRPFSPKH
jgi:hypothetical protein